MTLLAVLASSDVTLEGVKTRLILWPPREMLAAETPEICCLYHQSLVTKSMSCLMFISISLKGRVTERLTAPTRKREIKRNLPCTGSLPNHPQQPELGQTGVGAGKSTGVPYAGGRGPGTRIIRCCFPGCSSGKLHWKQRSQECSDMDAGVPSCGLTHCGTAPTLPYVLFLEKKKFIFI